VLGYQPIPVGVAALYADLCSTFVLDRADADDAQAVAAHIPDIRVADTPVHRGADPSALADVLLAAGTATAAPSAGGIG
jgi:hypothetical protein